MEENIYENFIHKKCSDTDDALSVNTDIPSDPWFDEEDIISSTPIQNFDEKIECNDNNLSFIYSRGLDESKLIEEEIDLYNDLIVIEDGEKKSKLIHDSEVESLKSELNKLKKADAIKSAKISELTTENTNLKKSIVSLYQTVKSEIEHKDHLLSEANRKIDSILFHKNRENHRYDSAPKNESSNKDAEIAHKDSHKRKRSVESPRSSHNEKGNKLSRDKAKDSCIVPEKRSRYGSQSNCSKSKDNRSNQVQKSLNERTLLETPETVKFSENSRDSTETNNLFFNLAPKPLKKAFYEYEQSQIISLNKLKQSFINDYFDSSANIPPPNLESTPKRPRVPWNHRPFNKNHQDASSVNTMSLLTPSSNQNDRSVLSSKYDEDLNKNNYCRSALNEDPNPNDYRDCKITRTMQKNLVSLYKYKKERIPFLVKRKFGLLKEGKDLIPENLL